MKEYNLNRAESRGGTTVTVCELTNRFLLLPK
jgi:hypothetical protein